MHRRLWISPLVVALLFGLAACHNKKVENPIAEVDSKQPDKVLFDRAMDAMKHNQFDIARLNLQTLMNTYPDSEFVARSKLAIGDSWYAEGGSASLTQAEAEYRDFIVFYPNMAEAAEAQYKIAMIEYRQMEKSDRDDKHTLLAQEEFRTMITTYPDSKLVPEAKEKLREVQELLAEREYGIGHFYYMRGSYAAAIARLKSLTDTYPLYSGAADALFLLGDCYDHENTLTRDSKLAEDAKGRVIKEWSDDAAATYSRIITRYPVSDRAADAKKRLEDMHRPVPTPTAEAIALNKAEEASEGHPPRFHLKEDFHKRPNTIRAVKLGDPTLVDPPSTSAPDLMRQVNAVAAGKAPAADTNKVSIETVGGTPAENQAAPRTDSADPATSNIPELAPAQDNSQPQPAPPQINQVDNSSNQGSSDAGANSGANQASSGSQASSGNQAASSDPSANGASSQVASNGTNGSSDSTDNSGQSSSSKEKKKKGLSRLNPF